jgi:polyisoprenoid-binding protein YceI
MIRFTRLTTALALLLLAVGLACGEPLTFTTDEADNRNTAMFESDAPLEKVVGRTHELTATLTFDPEDLSQTITGRFEVNLNSLDTGLQLRNQHMRENHLETDRFPMAIFTISSLEPGKIASLAPGQTVSLIIEGDLKLHGVTKSYRIPGELTYSREGNRHHLTGQAQWGINLQDHDIHRPRYLFMKLAEEQVASIKFFLTADD